LRCLAALVLLCLGTALRAQAPEPLPEPLLEAAHCLANTNHDWLGLAHDASQLDLGYVVEPTPYRGEEQLYLVEYTNKIHSRGSIFAFLADGKEPHRVLRLEYKAAFRRSVDGSRHLELVDPPLGGIWTQEQLFSAIRQVGFETHTVSVADLLLPSDSVECDSAAGIE
jgi:hypothetical protein